MDKNVFPQKYDVFESQEMSIEKEILQKKLLYQYLTRKINGWTVRDFLSNEGIEKYALYAATDLTFLFCEDLEKNHGNGSSEEIIYDRKAEVSQFQFKGHSVLSVSELVRRYKDGKIRKIIIMSTWNENQIINDLIKRGIVLNDIISVVSVLYS